MRRTPIIVFVLLSGLAVSAFAQSYYEPNSYKEHKHTMSNRERDIAVCRYETAKATASGPVGSFAEPIDDNVWSRIAALELRREELMVLCMQAKGYDRW